MYRLVMLRRDRLLRRLYWQSWRVAVQDEGIEFLTTRDLAIGLLVLL